MSEENSVPLFIEKSIRFIEQHGIAIEGLYRISGYKNQVDFVIQKLIEGSFRWTTIISTWKHWRISFTLSDPNCDLNNLQIPASAVATALKDIMRKLDEPILSLEQFEECQTLTGSCFLANFFDIFVTISIKRRVATYSRQRENNLQRTDRFD